MMYLDLEINIVMTLSLNNAGQFSFKLQDNSFNFHNLWIFDFAQQILDKVDISIVWVSRHTTGDVCIAKSFPS